MDNVKPSNKKSNWDNVAGSDEKLKKTESGPESNYKGKKGSYDYTSRGKLSDDKMSRSSISMESEADGKVIR